MEIHRLKHICSPGLSSSSKRRTYVTWLGCVVIFLHIYSILCRSWYSFFIDLDTCISCGSLIVTIGTIFDSTLNHYIEDMGLSQRNYTNHFGNTDGEYKGVLNEQENEIVFRDSLREKQEDEFSIENGVFVYIGLWTVMVCHMDGVTCAEVDHATSGLSLKNIQPISDILDSLYDCRPFLLFAVVCNILMVLFTWNRPVNPPHGSARLIALLGTASAMFSLLTMVISGMPYVTSVSHFRFIFPSIPWAFLCTVLSGYLSFVIGYQLWNTHSSTQLTFRNWQAQNLYKFDI